MSDAEYPQPRNDLATRGDVEDLKPEIIDASEAARGARSSAIKALEVLRTLNDDSLWTLCVAIAGLVLGLINRLKVASIEVLAVPHVLRGLPAAPEERRAACSRLFPPLSETACQRV